MMKDEKNQEIAAILFAILEDVYQVSPWSQKQILTDTVSYTHLTLPTNSRV